jgi:hypothetical protein
MFPESSMAISICPVQVDPAATPGSIRYGDVHVLPPSELAMT